MRNISKQLQTVRPSATIAMSQKARELAAEGHDVISLSAGEPDFDTPEHIRVAANQAIADGKTRYTAVDGIAELKQAISAKFLRDNGLHYNSAQINVSPGGKAVLFNALMATLNPGDEVIVPAPCWVSYPEMVRLCGGSPIVIHCDATTDYKLTPQMLESAITPRTKWLILNSPSNPTGACYSEAELVALGEVLERHENVMVLTDDIYEKLIFDGRAFSTLATAVPALKDRVLTMNGVSKTYAMTGWRIGYAGGPEWLISAMKKVMSQTTSNASSISQWAAVEALNGSHGFLPEWLSAYQSRRDFVCRALSETNGLSCVKPSGAFYIFVNCSAYIGQASPGGRTMNSDTDFADALLEESHVAVVPGSAFHAPGHFRLSFATDMDSLKEATQRLKTFCEDCER